MSLAANAWIPWFEIAARWSADVAPSWAASSAPGGAQFVRVQLEAQPGGSGGRQYRPRFLDGEHARLAEDVRELREPPSTTRGIISWTINPT
ncbi:MAG: hypothetical protein U0164_08310 [Gemmatimonadaceae bacterium]